MRHSFFVNKKKSIFSKKSKRTPHSVIVKVNISQFNFQKTLNRVNMEVVLSTGFSQIVNDFHFENETQKKGKALVAAEHMINVKEYQLNGPSLINSHNLCFFMVNYRIFYRANYFCYFHSQPHNTLLLDFFFTLSSIILITILHKFKHFPHIITRKTSICQSEKVRIFATLRAANFETVNFASLPKANNKAIPRKFRTEEADEYCQSHFI